MLNGIKSCFCTFCGSLGFKCELIDLISLDGDGPASACTLPVPVCKYLLSLKAMKKVNASVCFERAKMFCKSLKDYFHFHVCTLCMFVRENGYTVSGL